jgi:hypothetical protein
VKEILEVKGTGEVGNWGSEVTGQQKASLQKNHPFYNTNFELTP